MKASGLLSFTRSCQFWWPKPVKRKKKKTEKKNSGTLHFECKLTEYLLFLVQLVHLYLKVTNYSRYNWHEQCTHFKIISISLCFSQWLKVENQDLSRQLAELQKLDSQDRFVNELIPIGTHFSNSSSINLPPLEMPQIQLPPKLSSDSEDDLSDRIWCEEQAEQQPHITSFGHGVPDLMCDKFDMHAVMNRYCCKWWSSSQQKWNCTQVKILKHRRKKRKISMNSF